MSQNKARNQSRFSSDTICICVSGISVSGRVIEHSLLFLLVYLDYISITMRSSTSLINPLITHYKNGSLINII